MKHYKYFCKTNGLKDCMFSSLQAYKLHLNMNLTLNEPIKEIETDD